MKILVAGWFSFEQMGATAGDILARDLTCKWLNDARICYDIAVAHPFKNGIYWQQADPTNYTHVLFVCGPFGNGWPITAFLDTFAGCRLIGLNLSMLESLDAWNPFDILIERDSSRAVNPDIAFLARSEKVPVVGKILVHPQKEYGGRARHTQANSAVERLLDTTEAAIVTIDTRLDENSTGLRTPAEVESLIAQMDLVVTTRLHGMVLALKNGIPVLAIDPIAEGAKIRRQAEAIGWPITFTDQALCAQMLRDAFDYCLTQDARDRAHTCAIRAAKAVQNIKQDLIKKLSEKTI